MNRNRLDFQTLLVESKISDMRREAAQRRLVDEANARAETGSEARPRRNALMTRLLETILWLALIGRRAELSARQRATQPKTRSQTMQIPPHAA